MGAAESGCDGSGNGSSSNSKINGTGNNGNRTICKSATTAVSEATEGAALTSPRCGLPCAALDCRCRCCSSRYLYLPPCTLLRSTVCCCPSKCSGKALASRPLAFFCCSSGTWSYRWSSCSSHPNCCLCRNLLFWCYFRS